MITLNLFELEKTENKSARKGSFLEYELKILEKKLEESGVFLSKDDNILFKFNSPSKSDANII